MRRLPLNINYVLLRLFFIVVQSFVVSSAFNHQDVDDSSPVVDTDGGLVRGFRYSVPELGGISGFAFLGIPFAKPPVGRLRFRYPEPLRTRWTGVLNGTRLPNSCHQAPDLFFGPEFPGSTMWNPNTEVSEDCLYINVWIPDAASTGGGRRNEKTGRKKDDGSQQPRKLAVMVWIFGGGFYSGTPTLDVYDGRILSALHDVIVVSIGYRVGAFGFLCLDHPSAPCNAGLYDQLLGLDWVQRNVEAFGGDPGNVTLFGESAGSASVSLHLLSPLSHDKFHRAILQSGSANMPWATTTMAEGRLRSEELAITYLGCERTTDMQQLSDCLRQFEPSKLIDEQWVSRGILQFPFLPVVDGKFLPEKPDLLLEHRRFKHCPLLTGSNRNEGSWFIVYELNERLTVERKDEPRVALEVPPDDRAMMPREQFLLAVNALFFYYPQYRRELNSTFGLDAISFQYTDWTRPSPDDSASNLAGLDGSLADSNFVCPLNRFMHAYAQEGLPVYAYYFTHAYRSSPWPSWMGVMHGDEILFMFGHVFREPTPKDNKFGIVYTSEDRALSRRMMRHWTNFAKTGDPNSPPDAAGISAGTGRVPWPLHTASRREFLELNAKLLDETDPTKVIGRALRAKQCAFWYDYLPKLVTSTENISEKEKEWKLEFSEWTTRYIVDWKTQYDLFVRQQREGCPPR